MRDRAVQRWSRLHTALYRVTGGSVGRRLVGNDMLLLTTTGHRTGNRHTVPLLYLRDGDRLLIVASYGGRDRHPTWYRNLTAQPLVEAQVGSSRMTMRARTATEEERNAWWPRVVETYGDYAIYQSRTDRMIPVVFLEASDQAEHETG